MPKKFQPLTAAELKEIERRRAQARKWARQFLNEPPRDDDAALTAAAEADPDNPPITDEQWRQMRPAHLVHPELIAARLRRERGRPKSPAPKQQVTLRIDRDVLEKFRATGDGWQSRINAVLRKAAKV